MPPKNSSFVLTEEILDRLDNRTYPGLSKSETLRQDLETYWAMLDIAIRQVRRILTRNEAMLILDVQNGAWMGLGQEAGMWLGSGLLAQVEDGCRLDALDQKWSVDKDAILRKLRDMHPLQRFALADWCRWLWGSHTRLSLGKDSSDESAETLWERELDTFQPNPAAQEA